MSTQLAVRGNYYLLYAALACAVMLAAGEARAFCPWRIDGKLKVNHKLSELDARDDGSLKNVEVKVWAKEKLVDIFGVEGWGTWNAWPTTRTGDDGSFRVSNNKDCHARRFKIQVRFKDDDLEVRHEFSTSWLEKVKWYTILDESTGEHGASTTDFGTFTFNAGAAEDLSDNEAWSHADIWYLYKKAIAQAASYGSDYAFTSQVVVKYPNNTVISDSVESSYCNPTTQVIYIFRSSDGSEDHYNVPSLLHELGHKWAYNHTSGEFCLTETFLLSGGNVHGIVSDPCVAFHEGWARFFADEMERAIFGGDKKLPHGRPTLNKKFGLTSTDLMQRSDEGWWSIFQTLTTPKLPMYDFGTPTSTTPTEDITRALHVLLDCSSPDLTLKDVMTVFNSSRTFSRDLSRAETTIESFLNRAEARLGGLSDSQSETIKKLVDPASSVQPADELCTSKRLPSIS